MRFIGFLAGVSALAIAGAAMAQPATTPPAPDNSSAAASPSATSSEVIVTGSHVIRNGNASPTPLTVANAEQLKLTSPINLSNGLAMLPSFTNTGPGRGAFATGQITGQQGNLLNLRNLGPQRTLVLMDGRRVPPTSFTGLVDVDVIPEMLVSRVDTVTGGASAAYGSDAVAGVVNYILDTRFVGLKLEASGGMSNYAGYKFDTKLTTPTQQACCDGKSYRIGGAWGHAFFDGRLHVEVAAEHVNDDPVLQASRPYINNAWWLYVPSKPTTGAGAIPAGTVNNPYTLMQNVVQANRSVTPKFTGCSVANPSALPAFTAACPVGIANTYVTQSGQLVPWDFGQSANTANFQVGGSGWGSPDSVELIPGFEQTHVFGGVNFDITEHLNAWTQLIYSKNITRYDVSGTSIAHPIYSGNPYLPPSIQALMTNNNLTSVQVQQYLPQAFPLYGRETTDDLIVMAGLKGDIAWGWKFDMSYAYGSAHDFNVQQHPNQPRIYAALDAVTDPATGNPTCRVTLTNPGLYPGCQPLNLFTYYGASKESLAYIMPLDWYRSAFTTNDFTINFNGELFHTWAGPIGAAFGFEYRTRDLVMTSNGDPNIAPLITGIRGIASSVKTWTFLNQAPINGKDNVKEGYVELNIPLARDMPFARALDINGAVRFTDYSISGRATTYKVGGVWEPTEGLRVRGTISRDIRAPYLSELFGLSVGRSATQTDPHCQCPGQYDIITGGNPNLNPEIAQTYTGGVVFAPPQVRNFSVSLDWYSIDIQGAISVPNNNTASVLQACVNENGTGPDCAFITYPLGYANTSAANFPTQVFANQQNVSEISTSGIDIEASYRFDLNDISEKLRGQLSVRALANFVSEFKIQATPTAPIYQVAGTTDDIGSGSNFGPVPHWKGLFTVDYTNGGFQAVVQTQLIGPMTVGPQFFYVQNQVPAVVYVNTTLSYTTRLAGANTKFFFTVNNLFNQLAPLVPQTSNPGIAPPTAYPLYDLMGRYFTLGVKTQF